MYATFRQSGPTESGRPIRGTFYPSDGPGAGSSIGSVLPKLLAMLVAMAVVRKVVGAKRRRGSSGWSRRREAVAEFHRELHADEGSAQSGEAVKA